MDDKNNTHDEFFGDPVPEPAPEPPRAGRPAPSKRTLRALAIVGAVFLAVVAFLAGWFGHYYSLDSDVRTFLWAEKIAERNYYRPIDEEALYGDLYGLLELDDYSKLYRAEEYAEYEAENEGRNVGTGLYFLRTSDGDEKAHIFLSAEGSPACKAGIRKGMYVHAFGVSEQTLKEGSLYDLSDFLREQDEGEPFVLSCGYREDGSDAACYVVSSSEYQMAYAFYRDAEISYRFSYTKTEKNGWKVEPSEGTDALPALGGNAAYIRLEEFSGKASAEFRACLSLMKQRGKKDLVLDLRSNGGGYLDILGEVASHMLRNAEGNSPVLLKADYRNGTRVKKCTGNDFSSYFARDSRVVVLADEYTASASECLIGALLDYGTCTMEDIYLREDEFGSARTFGKGIMQETFFNANGAAMKLTVATVLWPLSGSCIHGTGITPALPSPGAHAVPGDLFWGETDVMLESVLSELR